MNRKKKFLLTVMAAIFIMAVATGCGNDKKFAGYREWYKALKVESTSGISLLEIKEEDDYLAITVNCSDANMDKLNGIIQRHNEFVEAHPGYFGDDISVYFIYAQGSKKNFNSRMFFYNRPKEGSLSVSGDGIQNGEDIKYVLGDMYDFVRISKACDTEYAEQVLVLESQDPGFYSEEDYKFLEQFPDLKQVILKFTGDNDMDEVIRRINNYTSDVAIYEVIEGNELNKLQ